jgi:acyl carrier protein
MTEIASRVRQYIEENVLLGQPIDGFTEEASFLGLGILDSTSVLELIAFLEDEFGIRVADAEMIPDNLDSLGAIGSFVGRKLAERAA